ncbi:Uncharacterized protein APZ42_000245, partial [Daphnia magna]
VMLSNKIIRESHSPFAAAIVMVHKKDGEMRMCIDYRALNKISVKDKYPLPRIDDTIDALCGSVYFSTLDLLSGYWQIEIEESDKHKTAFICEFCEYECLTSYFRKFIHAFADKAHPLTALTRKSAEWKEGEEQRGVFDCFKNCLITRPVLGYPYFSREFIIYTDASGYGIGAVLAKNSLHLNKRIQRIPTDRNFVN